jgi:hypothetical protein
MFQPTPVPSDAPGGLKAWLADQLRRIANELQNPYVNSIRLSVTGVAPTTLNEGTIVFADGTSWNPGSGRGFYGYRSGAWRKLD